MKVDEKIRKAFKETVIYKGAHSKEQIQDRYPFFQIAYKSRDKEFKTMRLVGAQIAK